MFESKKLHKKCKNKHYNTFSEEFNHTLNNKHVKSKKIDLSQRKKLYNNPDEMNKREMILDLLFGN